MSEIRYTEVYKDGALVEKVPYTVSDEELTEEVERNIVARTDVLIDGIASLADAKTFLKRLCKRLLRNGTLP